MLSVNGAFCRLNLSAFASDCCEEDLRDETNDGSDRRAGERYDWVRVRHERENSQQSTLTVNSQQSKGGMNHYSLQYNIHISIYPVFIVQ